MRSNSGTTGAGRAQWALELWSWDNIKRSPARRHFRQEPSISEESTKEIKHVGFEYD